MSPRLFARVVSLEARKLMTYRVDFWANAIVAFAAELTVAYWLWWSVFTATGAESIGGFGFDGMVVYYVAAILIGKLVRGQDRNLAIARDIYEGSLSRYLVFPSTYVGFKYAEHLGSLVPGLVQVVLFGGAAAFWLDGGGVSITPATLAMTVVTVAAANVLVFALRFPVQGVAFWADNVWSLNVMLRFAMDFLGGLMLPLTLFPETLRHLLELTPFPYCFFFPVMVLIGEVDTVGWLRGLGVMAVWIVLIAIIGRLVWRQGEKTYTGVGI